MLNVNESATSIKPCYKMLRFAPEIWRYAESPYLCVFHSIRFKVNKKIGCLG